MSLATLGGILGGMGALGLALAAGWAWSLRRPDLDARVLPYLRDVTAADAPGRSGPPTRSALRALGADALGRAAETVERVLGGSASIQRRLTRAGSDASVHDIRVQQVVWGVIGFAATAALLTVRALTSPVHPVAAVMACGGAFVAGVMLRENRLGAQVRRREREIVAEFPTVAELLALAVAAGEGPVAALDRVVRRSNGALGQDLSAVLARIRTGAPVADAFDRLASETGVPVVSRFARGVAIAVERGTPLADVLHAQAGDVREAGRRALIEQASRKEIAMMVPVVFLILPTTVIIAFWPGIAGLTLSAP